MNLPRRSRTLPFLLITALALGACGDDTVEPRRIDFDELELALEENILTFDVAGDANSFLGDALAELADFGVEVEPAGATLPLHALQDRYGLRALPLLEPRVAFPPAVLGRTFVYDDVTLEWRVDEERTGAPATGIRVVWYATDGSGNPLGSQEIGYFDLTDQDSDGLSRLGVEVVRTTGEAPVTLADYTVGYASAGSGSLWSEQLEAEGFISQDGEDLLTFVLSGAASGDSATEAETRSFDLDFNTERLSYAFDLERTAAPDLESIDDDVVIQVNHGGAITRLELTLTQTDAALQASGGLHHQGAPVATISSGSGGLIYTKPGGGSFSGADQTRLNSVVVVMLATGYYLLSTLPLLAI